MTTTATTTSPKLPSIEETLKHPAYEDTIWNLQPTRGGKLPVAEGRGGPFNMAWEIHGEGPIKVIVRIPPLTPLLTFPSSPSFHPRSPY